MGQRYDVIVVGAGPTGCSAAITLARMDHQVLLVDRAHFPRDKVCGDGIGPAALRVLDRLGATPALEALGPWRTDGILVSSPDGTEVLAEYPRVDGFRNYGYVLPRTEFDLLLWEQAKRCDNVEALEGCRVTGLIRGDGAVDGVEARIGTEQTRFHGSFVIAADGCHSIIAHELGLHNRSKRHSSFAVRAYFDGVEDLSPALEIHYEKTILPGYGWIFATGEHTANVGVGVMERFGDRKTLKAKFDAFVAENRFAQRKLGRATMRAGSFKGWPLPNGSFPGKRGSGNVLLAGDAGSFVDPISGEGIFYALKSGELAASAIHHGLTGATRGKSVVDIYAKTWRKSFLWRDFKPAFLLQRLLVKKTVLRYVIRRAKKSRSNARVLAGAISHIYPKRRLLYNL